MRRRAHSFVLVCGLLATMIGTMQLSSLASNPGVAVSSETSAFGVNVLGSVAPYDVAQLNIGWYMNWSYAVAPARPNGVAFAQTIRLRDDPINPGDDYWPPDWDTVEAAVAANPGALWLIGNEPDHRGQDNCLATEYADRYHTCYTFIKTRDISARVAPAGLVQVTPLRLHWLNDVLAAYQTAFGAPLPADAWQIHGQILCETCAWGATYPPGLQAYQQTEGRYYSSQDAASVSIFSTMVRDFRTWMRDNGYRDVPLIISEYGVLQPSGCGYLGGGDVALGNQMVRDFMTGTADFLLETTDADIGYPLDGGHLAQQWAWYSLNARMSSPDCTYLNSANGSLYDWADSGLLTEFGVLYKQYTDALLPTVTPTATRTSTATPSPTATATSTPSPTPTATGDALLVGHTTPQRYQAAGDAAWVTDLTLGMRDVASSALLEQGLTTDAFGVFTTTVASGTYDVGVKGRHTLESRKRSLIIAPDMQPVDFGVLLEGDANDDNEVSILDYSLLYSLFDSVEPAADFNQDGLVDVLDYSLLYTNFDRVGPIYVSSLAPFRKLDQVTVRLALDCGDLAMGTLLPVTVEILAGTAEVDACQLRLRYDPSVLRVVDEQGQGASEVLPGEQMTQIIRNAVDNEIGEIYFVSGAAFGAPPATGEIIVARFWLRTTALQEQSTTLSFAEATIGRSGMPHEVSEESTLIRIVEGYHIDLPLITMDWRPRVGYEARRGCEVQ